MYSVRNRRWISLTYQWVGIKLAILNTVPFSCHGNTNETETSNVVVKPSNKAVCILMAELRPDAGFRTNALVQIQNSARSHGRHRYLNSICTEYAFVHSGTTASEGNSQFIASTVSTEVVAKRS